MSDEGFIAHGGREPKPFVVFATPTFTASVAYEFAGAMEQTASLLTSTGIGSAHRYHPGLQFVEVARNLLVASFLQEYPDATDLFFIDDDVGFPPHKVLEFLMRPEPIVAGIPILKSEGPPQFPVFLHSNNAVPIEQNGLYLAKMVPCGFLRIKRHVLETLAVAAPTYQHITVEDVDATVVFKLFDRGDHNGEFLGEDNMFCRLIQEHEFEIWVDADIEFTHRGTRRWKGSFRDAMNLYLEGTSKVAIVREIK